MSYSDLVEEIIQKKGQNDSNNSFELLLGSENYSVFAKSIQVESDFCAFMIKEGYSKFLMVLFDKNNADKINFIGNDINLDDETVLRKCSLNVENSIKLQEHFKSLKPKVFGLKNSFGFGDRLGIANAGHLRSLDGYDFKPILAQQSIRELGRTQRKPEDVMSAAVFAAFQEGWLDGFGADADHLKTQEDVDLMLREGYTFFTFDPSDYVNNDADSLSEEELDSILSEFDWNEFDSNYDQLNRNYCLNAVEINNGELSLNVTVTELKRALVKYGNALIYIKKLFDYLTERKGSNEIEVEVSVDETESVTTAFEHFFISNELHRLKVEYISLAPRFIGDFEKGIDYIGNIDVFEEELKKHISILKHFGDYKLSLHSGSDKFTVYKIIAKYDIPVHIKTAGTSYLEALRVVASVAPELFRSILDYSRSLYNEEKKTYHVSATIENTKPAAEYSDEELPDLLNDNNARQILHVTYGRILTDKDEEGKFLFKDELFNCLLENQDLYDEFLKKHFIKHLLPFKGVN